MYHVKNNPQYLITYWSRFKQKALRVKMFYLYKECWNFGFSFENLYNTLYIVHTVQIYFQSNMKQIYFS